MVTVAKITADLLTNDAKFVEGMNRAATSVGRFAQSAKKDIENISKQFDKLQSSISGVKGVLSVAGIALLTKRTLESADAIEKLSQKLGLTTDEIQKYEYAAKQSGATNEDLQTSFNYLNKLIAEGKVPYHTLNEGLLDIANRMQNASTGAQRAKIAFDTFGKSGISLIPMLLQGAAGIKRLGEEAVRIGAVLPEDVINRAVKFKDQIDTLGTVITKNFQAGALSSFVNDSDKIRNIYTDPKFAESVRSLGEAFGALAAAAVELAKVPAYLRAIFIEMPELAGKQVGNVLAGNPALNNPRVSLGAGSTTSVARRAKGTELSDENAEKINAAFRARGMKELDFSGASKSSASGSPRLDLAAQKESQLQKYIQSLQDETKAIGMSEKALYQQQAAQKAVNAAHDDMKNSIPGAKELTMQERQAVMDLAGSFYDLKQAQKEAEHFNEEFKAGFEDAAASIVSGSKSIGDAIKGLVIQFAALIEKQLILQPLANSIFGAQGTGGGFGIGGLLSGASSLSSLFGGSQGGLARLIQTGSSGFIGPLPSFDTGISNVPHDMIANIHKNEAVLTPAENAAYQRGDKGGDNYYIDAHGASKSDITQLKALIMSLAGPGRVEDRVRDARQRGKNL